MTRLPLILHIHSIRLSFSLEPNFHQLKGLPRLQVHKLPAISIRNYILFEEPAIQKLYNLSEKDVNLVEVYKIETLKEEELQEK